MQVIFNDKGGRSDTMLDIKEFNNKSLAKQAKKGEQIVSMMPDFEKAFELMCDDRVN